VPTSLLTGTIDKDRLPNATDITSVGTLTALVMGGTLNMGGQDITSGGNITGSNLTLSGDLTVNGTTTTINTTNLDVDDNLITLNKGIDSSSTNPNDIGFIFERGTSGNNAAILWDESEEHFLFGTSTTDASNSGAASNYLGGKIAASEISVGKLLLRDGPANVERQLYFENNKFFAGNHAVAAFSVGLNNQKGDVIGIDTNDGNDLDISAPNDITLTPGGNVGIGTSTPNELLHVEDAFGASGTSITIQNGFGESPKNIKFRYNDTVETARIEAFGRNSSSLLPYLAFHVNQSTSSGISDTVAERMRIDSSGDVGIGTTSPRSQLDVSGSIISNTTLAVEGMGDPNTSGPAAEVQYRASDGAGRFYAYDRSTSSYKNVSIGEDYIYAKNDGNVGIGTTSPSERLEIREDIDNDYVRLKLDNQGSNGGASIFFNEGATTHASIFATYGTGHKSFNIKNGMPNGTLELQTTNSSGTTNDGLIIDGDSNVSIPNGSVTTTSLVAENLSVTKAPYQNTITGNSDASIAIGASNTANGRFGLLVGSSNTNNGNLSLAVGIGNTTNKSGNYALGDRNVVGHPTSGTGGNSATIGSDNVLHGGNSFVAGNNNNISSVTGANSFESSSIIGNNNNISGSLRAFILGQNNTITNANDSVAIGKGSNLTGNNSIAVGTGLKDFADANTVILGRYNADPGDSSKVVIGAGFSNTGRYNAIEIESKGASMRARSKFIFRSLMDTNSYSSDSAAAAAGVVLGELYRDGNIVKIRMT
jgi:hypothetical protein